MNGHLLIDAIVQQTMVFIAQLATAGGVRAPLAHVADQIFLNLTNELQGRGVKKKVIADMFGMALRTYHRRVREAGESRTDAGKSVWEAVLQFVRQREPVTGRDVLTRFSGDDAEVVSGVLSDLTQSGLVYRSGRGDGARYRAANESDFSLDEDDQKVTREYLVWLAVYRTAPATQSSIVAFARLSPKAIDSALETLIADGRVDRTERDGRITYTTAQFEVPMGASKGWEAAVLDHFQALVASVIAKLQAGQSSGDLIGGSTWSLDVWRGHPMEAQAKGLLARIRKDVEDLRGRIDAHNARTPGPLGERQRIVFYAGQHVREDNNLDTPVGGSLAHDDP